MTDIHSQGDVNIGGDVVGRDKNTTTTNNTTERNITVGNITGSTGIGIGDNVHVTVTQGPTQGEALAAAFAPILEKVLALPEGPAKTMAQQAAQGLKAEAEKGPAADEKTANDWFAFLAQTAPDAWDVALALFTNPIAGVSTIFQKITARARAEKEAKQAAGSGQ